MKLFLRVILVLFGIGQIVDNCDAIRQNLFYGNCARDNNTMSIYTQVVNLNNNAPKPTRKWYDYMVHPFRRHARSPPSSIGSRGTINATIDYPPPVSASCIPNILISGFIIVTFGRITKFFLRRALLLSDIKLTLITRIAEDCHLKEIGT